MRIPSPFLPILGRTDTERRSSLIIIVISNGGLTTFNQILWWGPERYFMNWLDWRTGEKQ